LEVLKKFTQNMRKQIELYQTVKELEKAKQDVLVKNDIKELDKITAQEENILFQIGKLEAERLGWAQFFSQEFKKDAEEITLEDMVQRYPELEDIGRELSQVIGELRDLHEINTKMLQNAVSIVSFTVQSLTGERKTTYLNPAAKGNQEKTLPGNRSLIDKSV
jgi:flagellar biosynthesis/type III secretory pathway chaperone